MIKYKRNVIIIIIHIVSTISLNIFFPFSPPRTKIYCIFFLTTYNYLT